MEDFNLWSPIFQEIQTQNPGCSLDIDKKPPFKPKFLLISHLCLSRSCSALCVARSGRVGHKQQRKDPLGQTAQNWILKCEVICRKPIQGN